MHFQKKVMMKKLMNKIKLKQKCKTKKVNQNSYRMIMKTAVTKKLKNQKMQK